jgi:superfamily II DNA or RNA helicase
VQVGLSHISTKLKSMTEISLRDLNVRAVYGGNTPSSALKEFLIPALGKAISYQRVAGYFSSTIFALAAQGISGLVANGGRMQLVTSHVLSSRDYLALDSGSTELIDLESSIFNDFRQAATMYGDLATKMKSDYVKAMCWLLKEGLLEIKVVVPASTIASNVQSVEMEKFHPKFGIITDAKSDSLIFSGSVNETRLGWNGNVENLSIYNSWTMELQDYCTSYEKLFQDYWNGENIEGWTTISLPDAIKRDLISLAPEGSIPDLSEWETPDIQESDSRRKPREYQLTAISEWEKAGRVGLLEMATGTGKTFTAKNCLQSAMTEGSLITVVVAPYQHISDQWTTELEEFDPVQIGAKGNWRDQLQAIELKCTLGMVDNLVLVVVKNTASSRDFLKATNKLHAHFKNFLFIGDEVHWLGAKSLVNALNINANYRLGLSATPDRYFDEEGTGVLKNYFGGESIYEFGLKEALEWENEDGTIGVLAPYVYKPVFVELTQEENAEYQRLSKLIAQKSSKKNQTREDREEIEVLLNKRADVAKSAAQKIPALNNVLSDLGPSLQQCLIYCADFNQMEMAMGIARKIGIDTSSRITGLEGDGKSEYFKGKSQREHILENFANGKHSALFAIACLDEGVDIPSAEIGIILASSGNPKEFIQRRGRLMRRSPETGKTHAVIYDMVVLQGDLNTPDALRRTELKRVAEFAELAMNRLEVESLVAAQLGE